jgi:hypothetical protein
MFLFIIILFIFSSCQKKILNEERVKNSKICIQKNDRRLFSYNTLGQVDNYFRLILNDDALSFEFENNTCNISVKTGNELLILHTQLEQIFLQNCLEIKEIKLVNQLNNTTKIIKKDEDIDTLIQTSSKVFKF